MIAWRGGILAAALMCALAGPSLAASLTDEARSALEAALEGEQKAEAFHIAVMDRFGEMEPFSNIVEAERTHQAELVAVMKGYGLQVPAENEYVGYFAIVGRVPSTLQKACAIALDDEMAGRDLYDRLAADVADFADIKAVFQKRRDASDESRLPAFKNCAGM